MHLPAHLHLHSHYSFLDGLASVEELVDLAVANGHKAMALTDHGNMCGAIRFYEYAIEQSIKPLIGQEFYFVGKEKLRVGQDHGRHLILIAKNQTGYHNLVKLSSFAHVKGFYYNPRINLEILAEHCEGLVCLTACLNGIVSKHILNGKINEAKESLLALKTLFNDDLYIELQTNTQEDQKTVNKKLIEFSEEFDIKAVVTNDVHYQCKEHFNAHDAWNCVKYAKRVGDLNRLKHEVNDYYFTAEVPEYIQRYVENIQEVVDKCNVTIELGNLNFPKSELENPVEFIRTQCLEALNDLSVFKSNFSEYEKRTEYELSVIEKLGFGHYFVIIRDIIHWCKKQGIRTGPARGSGAGSLVCYLLGITEVDPVKHKLIFERFLHEERISPPDLDLDFQQDRRDEVTQYIVEKYGERYVSPVATFHIMKTKNSLRDAMRVLGIEYKVAEEISKMVHEGAESIDQAISLNPELQNKIQSNKLIAKAVDLAKIFEGHIRQCGTHAAGVVISPVPIDEIVPLMRKPKSGDIITQFDMRDIEKLGLLKMDILGLRTLTVMQKTIQAAIDDGFLSGEPDWTLDDPEVYKMIQNGFTKGCFMIETSLLTQAAKEFEVETFEDLVLIGAICRPVTMITGEKDKCLRNKMDPSKIKYTHPDLKSILEETHGVVVYQEQIMEIFRTLALFTWPESDNVRSLISKGAQLSVKNKQKKLSSAKHRFDIGTQKNHIKPKVANSTWDLVKDASYGFNKSHATSYATISYQTAWLKHYLPKYFMAAVMSSVSGDTNRVGDYIRECKRMGIVVTKPSIENSQQDFRVEGKTVRFGLGAIKNIGEKSATQITEAARDSTCNNFTCFVEQSKIFGRRKILEALVCAGALDDYIPSRRSVMIKLESVCKAIRDFHTAKKTSVDDDTLSLFSDEEILIAHPNFELENIEEFKESDLSLMEKEFLGVFLTSDPLSKYRDKFLKYCASNIKEVEKIKERCMENRTESGYLGGVIVDIQKFVTKNKDEMARVVLETIPGVYEIVCFPNEWGQIQRILGMGAPVIMKVNTTKQGDFACRNAVRADKVS